MAVEATLQANVDNYEEATTPSAKQSALGDIVCWFTTRSKATAQTDAEALTGVSAETKAFVLRLIEQNHVLYPGKPL